MTTIDKIRAEIERLKAYSEQMIKGLPHDLGLYYVGWMDLASKLLVFLDLEEPVSDCHDLEDEIHSFWNKCSEFQPPFCTLEVKENGFAVIARHFANWQKAKMMEGATYNELMELYRAIRDELVKRHRDVPVNIKEEL